MLGAMQTRYRLLSSKVVVRPLSLWVAPVIILLTITPYVDILGGLRLENVFIYLVASWMIFKKETWAHLNFIGRGILIALGFLFGWAATVSILNSLSSGDILWIKMMAGADTLLLPAATILAVAGSIQTAARVRCQRTTGWIFVAVLVVSVLLALRQPFHLSGALNSLWASQDSEFTVGYLAQQNNRYTGIFNQPIEAGAAAGLGLIVVLMLPMKTWIRVSLGCLFVVGGLLSGSKAFLAAYGLVFLIGMIRWKRPHGVRLLAVILLVGTFGALISTQYGALQGFANRWQQPIDIRETDLQNLPQGIVQGNPAENSYIDEDRVSDFLAAATAGRFGSATGIDVLASTTGNGLVRTKIPADNAFLDSSDFAGFAGIIAIGSIFAILLFGSFRLEWKRPFFPGSFAATLIMLVSSVGAGSLFMNRTSTYFWVLVTLVLLTSRTTTKDFASSRFKIEQEFN